MPKNEFELIDQLITHHSHPDVILGPGDDAAITKGFDTTISAIDTIVENTHFTKDTPARSVAYKLFISNISDFAAMASIPKYALCSLTLKNIKNPWINEFRATMHDLLEQYNIQLIGGDLTKGKHISSTLCLWGKPATSFIPKRSDAKPNDLIFITQRLGLPWYYYTKHIPSSHPLHSISDKAYHFPSTPLSFSHSIAPYIHACIDISDGLIQDLAHICVQSKLSAHINTDQLPTWHQIYPDISKKQAIIAALCGGEEYALCFTAPPEHKEKLCLLARKHQQWLCCIGKALPDTKHKVQLYGSDLTDDLEGYDHFKYTHIIPQKESIPASAT